MSFSILQLLSRLRTCIAVCGPMFLLYVDLEIFVEKTLLMKTSMMKMKLCVLLYRM